MQSANIIDDSKALQESCFYLTLTEQRPLKPCFSLWLHFTAHKDSKRLIKTLMNIHSPIGAHPESLVLNGVLKICLRQKEKPQLHPPASDGTLSNDPLFGSMTFETGSLLETEVSRFLSDHRDHHGRIINILEIGCERVPGDTDPSQNIQVWNSPFST